jgi:hypothetical protein
VSRFRAVTNGVQAFASKSRMSASGHSRQFGDVRSTSAFALKADIHTKLRHVSKVPIMDIDAAVCRGNRYPQDEDATKAPVKSLLRFMNRRFLRMKSAEEKPGC